MRLEHVVVWLVLFAGLTCAPCAHAQNQSGMQPFSMDHRRGFLSHSPVDVSFLLDAPAGKHGFLKVENGHLATGDGQRIRFWGVNITDWSAGSRQIPSEEDAPMWASTLTRFGVNCVRLQFLDLQVPRGLIKAGTTTRTLDAEALDREDFFIAQLEKRGIYIDFNLLVGRPFAKGDDVHDASLLREGAKGTSIFDARMIELQKEYASELLTHFNPYTKKRYIDDPAVAIVEINNENAIYVGFYPPSPFYQNELMAIYNRWLAQHRTPAQLAKLRALCQVELNDPVPLMQDRTQVKDAPAQRFDTEAEFFNDLQRSYFVGMEKYLKQTLGFKALVIATADHNHAGSGYPLLQTEASMDIIDGHDYWQHPEDRAKKSPMVNDPLHSTVVELSRSPLAGKPYIVSEVNNPFPNDYDGEGIPILAAYGSLQDWDGIFWYTFEPKIDPAWKPVIGDPFDISLDPLKMPELAAGALMFLRFDVQKASRISERSYSQQQVFDSMLLPSSDRPYFTPGFPLDLPLQHEVRIASLTGPPTQPFEKASTTSPIVSDTGELAWYTSPRQAGLVTVDTPRTQALIGFVKAQGKQVSNLAGDIRNDFSTIWLSSMDNQPISGSSSLLLVAGGPVQNTGQRWNRAGTELASWGTAATMVEPVQGTIILSKLQAAQEVRVQAIDGAGQPLGSPVLADKSGEDWKFVAGQTATTWYLITVVR